MKKTNLKSELKKLGKALEIEFNNVKALHQKSDFIIMTFVHMCKIKGNTSNRLLSMEMCFDDVILIFPGHLKPLNCGKL